MRQIKIAHESKLFQLTNVPEELKFVEQVAKQYAKTLEELEHYYSIGTKAAENLKSEYPPSEYEKKVVWAVRQAILGKVEKRNE